MSSILPPTEPTRINGIVVSLPEFLGAIVFVGGLIAAQVRTTAKLFARVKAVEVRVTNAEAALANTAAMADSINKVHVELATNTAETKAVAASQGKLETAVTELAREVHDFVRACAEGKVFK